MSILLELKERFRKALAGLTTDAGDLLELIRRSQDAKFGDYQANLAMPLGKQLRRPPRDVAAELIGRLDVADLCHPPEIAGPGFINLRLKDERLIERLSAAVSDPRLGVAVVAEPKTFVVDFSAPNVAKPMHVGHIRSTVIGDALCRILRFLGHQVISDNHIGDWGTQFGMILYGYRHFLNADAYRQSPVEELARLYRLVRRLMDYQADETAGSSDAELARLSAEHPQINAAVLVETAKLHAGDAENRRLWQEFLPYCEDEIDRVYHRLHVTFDHTLGESFYEDRLAAVVDDLLRRGIARESDGAVCIFFADQETPMIVRKKDGAFLYGTTDLATIRYRMETWRPDAILYVVDHRQSLHFQQLFTAARRLGYDNVELQHVKFGTVLGDDGRPFRTRSGDTIGLEGLLDEAVACALEIVTANDDAKPGGPNFPATAAPRRRDRGHRRPQVRRPLPEPHQRLRVQLRQDAGHDGQHGHVHAIRLRPRAEHFCPRQNRCRFIDGLHRINRACLAGGTGAWPGVASLRRGPGTGHARIPAEPTYGLPLRVGQSLFDVLRAMPRAPRGKTTDFAAADSSCAP